MSAHSDVVLIVQIGEILENARWNGWNNELTDRLDNRLAQLAVEERNTFARHVSNNAAYGWCALGGAAEMARRDRWGDAIKGLKTAAFHFGKVNGYRMQAEIIKGLVKRLRGHDQAVREMQAA